MAFWFGKDTWTNTPDKHKEMMKITMKDLDLEIYATMDEVRKENLELEVSLWIDVFKKCKDKNIPLNILCGAPGTGTHPVIASMANRLEKLYGFSNQILSIDGVKGLGHMAPVTHAKLVLPILAQAGNFSK